MGVVESKKDGIVRKFELKMDLHAPIRSELLELTACTLNFTQGLSQTSSNCMIPTAAKRIAPTLTSSPFTKYCRLRLR